MKGEIMSTLEGLASVSDGALRGVVARLVTRFMAAESGYRAIIQSVGDMDEVLSLAVTDLELSHLLGDSGREARALRAVCADLLRTSVLGDSFRALLTRSADTLIDPPTESVLHAATLMVLWPHIEAGYADAERRRGPWVVVKGPGLPDGLLKALREAL